MPRLYGFEDMAYGRVREAEAEGIRAAASRRRARQTFAAITEWMTEEGYVTTLGNPFKPDVLAGVLHHPAIAGLKWTEDGKLVDSGGPRIIPVEEFLEILAMKQDSSPAKGRDREYLLSGPLSVCGLCGATLGTSPSNAGARGHRCPPSTAQHPGGCGKVRINADLFETYVGEQVTGELAKPEVADLIGAAREELLLRAKELEKQVRSARRRQKKLGVDYATGSGLSLAAFKAADRELTKMIREKSTEARFLAQVKHVPVGDVPDLVRWWKHAPMKAKRGLVALLLERIAVYPAASRGSRTVDADRVALTWRQWGTAEETPSA
ncbi:recombinase family protein [Streptomyces sp. CFMR 7]|uniref:recombinase family protein n=1 Tax=Streptomyces sp. CFMR 7 TaxID=1649184 RepID=UPI00119DC4CD|nr:recombinase family protein [Streptomyces sp. CFMR 7]